MERFTDEKKVFLIGLLLSVVLHGVILSALIYLGKPEEKKPQKEKVVYINILKPQKKENKAPKVKKKLPSGQKKQVKPKRTKPKKKVLPKKQVKQEKKTQTETKPKPVKEIAKTDKVKEVPQKKVVLPPIKQEELQEVKEEIQNLHIDESILEADSFSISGLKGKELIYQHGSEEKKEEKVSDEDILAYIRELERYLNELARKKDLYPPMAKRLRIEGSLVVRFTIKADGSVDESSIQIIDSSNYNILDKGAVKLIKKYVPMFAQKHDRKPPKGDLTIELPITFEIIGW